MINVSFRRKTVLLLLVSVLVTPWASAAISQPESPRTLQAAEEPVALELFSRIWSFLRRVDSKAGSNIDPDGRCVNGVDQSQIPQPKAGCNIDPNGHCIP